METVVGSGLSLTSVMLLLPIVGLLVILFFLDDEKHSEQIKWTALGFSVAVFLASVLMAFGFDTSDGGLQFAQKNDWLPSMGVTYYVGVDGLSMLLVLLTTIIMPISIMASFTTSVIQERGRGKLYYMFMLLLEWSMLGVFVVQDLIIFYVFWEITLIPMYFLIGIWGAEQRVYAAVKFFLYTMAGSILMLLALLYVGNVAGTFAVPDIIAGVQDGTIVFPMDGYFSTQSYLFLGFLIAFAIKVPVWPLHSWLPDAHVQAPTAGSVILAGVLLKMGTYGMVRFCLPMFPEATVQWAPYIATLGVIGIIYGAWVCYAQTDIKKLVAYSSVSHLGFVVLGIFSLTEAGIQGATLQMVSHGISTGALFLIVGMLYERRHTKAMAAYGGIWKAMPLLGGITMVVSLSSMGLPGLNGFVGEFVILMGALGSDVLSISLVMVATAGVIMAAIYILYMFQEVFMGELDKPENMNLPKMTRQEVLVMIPLLILIFWIGLYPVPFFNIMGEATANLVSLIPIS
jgi:NADH-quinone oxidoreductase subunit M